MAIIIGAIIADRIILRWIARAVMRLGLHKQVVRSMMFFVRFAILAAALIALTTVTIVPTEWIGGVGALIGAALGFASMKAVSDFFSGAYVLMSGVVRIGDYVKIGGEEGVIVDMTISYTRIRRPDGSFFIISNKDLLSKSFINYRVERDGKVFYVYPLAITTTLDKFERVRDIVKRLESELEKTGVEVEIETWEVKKSDVQLMIKLIAKNAAEIPSARIKIMSALASELS